MQSAKRSTLKPPSPSPHENHAERPPECWPALQPLSSWPVQPPVTGPRDEGDRNTSRDGNQSKRIPDELSTGVHCLRQARHEARHEATRGDTRHGPLGVGSNWVAASPEVALRVGAVSVHEARARPCSRLDHVGAGPTEHKKACLKTRAKVQKFTRKRKPIQTETDPPCALFVRFQANAAKDK